MIRERRKRKIFYAKRPNFLPLSRAVLIKFCLVVLSIPMRLQTLVMTLECRAIALPRSLLNLVLPRLLRTKITIGANMIILFTSIQS